MSPFIYGMSGPPRASDDHASRLMDTINTIDHAVNSGSKIVIDGDSLDIGQLVAVACHGTKATLDRSSDTLDRIQASIDVLQKCLEDGQTIYGVNTGFGGSADVRTTKHHVLQLSLPKFLNSGILLSSDKGLPTQNRTLQDLPSHALPRQVVRATILIRANSIMRGHSAVRFEVIQAMMTLLAHDLIPIIPLRGSISASGDLAPLSYVVRALQGSPDILVSCDPSGKILPSNKALELAGLTPLTLGPKEGLGLLNGTATSCAYASLALHSAQQLALLTQILTAMGTEALLGHSSNFDPFIADTRPHSGQREAARNILNFLSGSRLATSSSDHVVGLAQDRYALRTASQWIGPQLEDLSLAETQLTTELNSTTDNPLIDSSTGQIHHGGNFQAASITSAMEKTRLALQMLGKLIFAQSQELVNPAFNKGLPPNLTAEEPSLCFTFKGADIAMAAYMSELAFLANPVSSHVHSAEMHNQAVNSLALISARYTMDAVEILSMMCATYLTELCQALDLRVRAAEFFKLAQPAFITLTQQLLPEPSQLRTIETLWAHLLSEWSRRSTLDLPERASETASSVRAALLDILDTSATSSSDSATTIDAFILSRTYRTSLSTLLSETHVKVQSNIDTQGAPTPQFLGKASRAMYSHVRETLGVPLQKDLEGPGFETVEADAAAIGVAAAVESAAKIPAVELSTEEMAGDEQRRSREKFWGSSVGTKVSAVYESLRSGEMAEAMIKCF